MIFDKRILEVCAGDILSVESAAMAGAHRIELCSSLEIGGVTPSAGLISLARKTFLGRIHVLIRPRGGDFFYSSSEIEIMAADIDMARQLGADGVVIGALTHDGNVDIAACRKLIRRAHDMSVTFHRAFDRTSDPMRALEDVIELGCDRILTSGCAPSAYEGIDCLLRLREAAGSRIGLIAAAGVNPSNAPLILDATGINEIHASARTAMPRPAVARSAVKMGASDSDDLYATSPIIVKEIIAAINS